MPATWSLDLVEHPEREIADTLQEAQDKVQKQSFTTRNPGGHHLLPFDHRLWS
jgi:hypothetical protein